jgi:hypothetical protein
MIFERLSVANITDEDFRSVAGLVLSVATRAQSRSGGQSAAALGHLLLHERSVAGAGSGDSSRMAGWSIASRDATLGEATAGDLQ